jgi:hypothetical protein
MVLVDKLKEKGFDPPLNRLTRVGHWRVFNHETLRILAVAVSESIDELGPQFSRDFVEQIEAAYEFHPYTPVRPVLDNTVRGNNSYYSKFGIKKVQLRVLLAGLYPEKPTKCRGTSSGRVILYKKQETLKEFVDKNFLQPNEIRDFWDYVPGTEN